MIERHVFEPLNETIYHSRMPAGLDVIILAKPGFSRKAATLLIPFGSIDESVILDKKKQVVTFPEGTAHFLEHMLFENSTVDITRSFSLLGASVNAYTTFNRTAIYFSTTNGMDAPLELLFDMMMHPDFSSQAIAKEKAIIEKEMDMYQDDLDQSLYYDLMNALYRANPIRKDIAGTKASLKKITVDKLNEALHLFYHPKNMLLVLSGDFDAEATLTKISQHPFCQTKQAYTKYHVDPEWEKPSVKNKYVQKEKDVRTDLVMLGIKLPRKRVHEPLEAALEETKLMLLLDSYLGGSSRHQEQMQKAGLINNTFDFSISAESIFSHVLLYTETKKPDLTIARWKELLNQIGGYLPKADDFIAQKRKIIGGFVQIFDSVSQANALLSDYFLKGINLFDLLQAVDRISIADLADVAHELAVSPVAVVQYSGRKVSTKNQPLKRVMR